MHVMERARNELIACFVISADSGRIQMISFVNLLKTDSSCSRARASR